MLKEIKIVTIKSVKKIFLSSVACVFIGCAQSVMGPNHSKEIDLAQAVIAADQSKTVHARAADMLADEIENRSGIRLAIVKSLPQRLVPAIVLATVPSSLLPKDIKVPSKPDGYAIRLNRDNSQKPIVYLAGHDDRGVLFAAGRLIRLLKFSRNSVRLSNDVNIATAPKYPIRGHQLGYRNLNNAFDTWDLATYEQYIRDLVLFGTNSIELIPILDPDKKPGHHMGKSMWRMNTELSEMLDSYGLDVWIWLKVMHNQIATPQAEKQAMQKRRALFKSFKCLDNLFVPGGDGGDTPVEVLLPWLGRLAKVLREVHPNAKLWVSNQVFEFEENDFFFNYLQTQKPDWLEGVIYGPWTKIPISEVRMRTPKKYKIRRYPDICHCLGCQYPVPRWDRAFALTHGREPVCPRPREMTHIHNIYAPLTDGFITYSDGVNDDLNKFIWSALGWNPRADIKDILKEYAKAFFGDEYADAVADGLLMLEDNWVGPILENDKIEKTLSHWQKISDSGSTDLSNNWRMQLYLFRASYDAYLRRKVITETKYEQQAMNSLARAEQNGVDAAINQARSKLAQIDSNPPAPELRKQIEKLGLKLFKSIGFQSSVKEPFVASGPRRGNVLDYLDRPLNDRLWLETEFDKILATEDKNLQLARLNRIINWQDPGPGGFYDDLGNPQNQPHLLRQKTWLEDPQLIRTPIDEHYYTKQVTTDRLSWLDQAHIRYSMGQHPPEDKLTPSQQQRIQAENLPLLTMRYDQLDPAAKYRLRITYCGRFRPETRLITDDKYEIHGPLTQPDPVEPLEFDIPHQATADEQLELKWHLLNNARGAQVSEVWLIKTDPQ